VTKRQAACPPPGAVALCVLAGGAGRRLGGTSKAALDLGEGRPLLSRVLGRLAPWPGPVLVSVHAETDRAGVAALAAPARVDAVVRDPITDADTTANTSIGRAGPLAGVLAALETVAAQYPDVPWLVTVPVDLPFVPPDLLAGLWRAGPAAGAPGAFATSDGRRHPLTSLWPANGAAALRHALTVEGLRRVSLWADRTGLAEASWPPGSPDPFLNLNDPDALTAARTRLNST